MRRKELGDPLHGEFRLVRLLPNAQAVIDIRGLCRLVDMPSGKPRFEMVDREFAHREVAMAELRREKDEKWLVAIDYETGKPINFDCRGLSDDYWERWHQLYWFDDLKGERGDTVKRYRKIYHRAKDFKAGRLMRGPAKCTAPNAVKLFKAATADKRPFRSAC